MFTLLKRYLKLYHIIISQFLKTIMQSKVDFFMGLLGFFLHQIVGIAFLYLIFEQIPSLDGWSFEQLVFIYGFAQIPRGIDHLFTDNIWMIAWFKVINGEIDRYMLRPMNVLFQIVSEKLQPDALGELLVGSILVIRGVSKGIVPIDFIHIILFILSILAGALIYTAIKLLFTSIAFWTKISGPFVQFAYEMSDFAKYPTEIYIKGIQFIITWIIPFAFVAYLPAKYFLGVPTTFGGFVVAIEWIIALIFGTIAYTLFNKGLSIYESAGN